MLESKRRLVFTNSLPPGFLWSIKRLRTFRDQKNTGARNAIISFVGKSFTLIC